MQLMNKIQKVKVSNNETANATEQRSNGLNSRTENTNKSAVNLPKIAIPYYDGSSENWQEFWSQFYIIVHQNNSLFKVKKFAYL